MSFQTTVRRNGQWVTQTVDVHSALKAPPQVKPQDEQLPERGPCGILSRTITESPRVNSVLSVRLRSKRYNDVAFIGDSFVEIKQFLGEGQTRDIIRKEDFGSRIRNATVIGLFFEDNIDEEDDSFLSQGISQTSTYTKSLPPQILVLVLANTDMLFLFVDERPDGFQFIVSIITTRAQNPTLGYHLVVDPSSRYLVSAGLTDAMIVYELHSWNTLNDQYRTRGVLSPFKTDGMRTIRGAIHSLEFLYPRLEDDYHIILALIASRREDRRDSPDLKLIVYDWEAGCDLDGVFSAQGKSGHRLQEFHDFPMFIIPLKFQSAFFLVYEDKIGLVKQPMSNPESEFSPLPPTLPSNLYHGKHNPLWVTWTRPYRSREYAESTDIIYLAREDGVLLHIEVDSTLMHSIMEIGNLNAGISSAFTSVYDLYSDIIVVGGDAGPGGIWKLKARCEPEQVSSLANWSPLVDVVATGDSELASEGGNALQVQGRPERIFFASGRGDHGYLVEHRVGLQARIGLEIDIGEPIRNAWLLQDERVEQNGMFAILAMPHSSAILRLSQDFGDVDAESADNTPFDTSSRTLLIARNASSTILQVTETSVTLAALSQSSRHHLQELTGTDGSSAESASYLDDVVVISTTSGLSSKLHVLRIEQMDVVLDSSWSVNGEISCTTLFTFNGELFVLVGSQEDGDSTLSIFSLEGKEVARQSINERKEDDSAPATKFENLTSLCVVQQTTESIDVIGGTRCGHLVTIRIVDSTSQPFKWIFEKIGQAPVDVFPTVSRQGLPTGFACCDGVLIHLSAFVHIQARFGNKDIVWATDQHNLALPAPPIHSVYNGRTFDSQGPTGNTMMVLLSGTKFILADVTHRPASVPRYIPLRGTPTKVMYSSVWKCFVVGLIRDNQTALAFVDCDSGSVISSPVDRDKNSRDYISGLGVEGDRIMSLCEWLYVKDGSTFPFLIVTTRSGGLMIVSVRSVPAPLDGRPGQRLEFWTRYRKKSFREPVYSVVPHEDGLIYSVGRTIHWDVLDLAEKKIKPVFEYDMNSPAVSLRLLRGQLLALTTKHSVEVISFKGFDEDSEAELVYTDQNARQGIHMTNIGPADDAQWPITVVSDPNGVIAGLWMPWSPSSQRKQELVTVFEGRLPKSVRKFILARSRPTWLQQYGQERKFGSIASAPDGAEMLGVSLDGTVRHFTIIGLELWRLLYFLQQLARRATPGVSVYETDSQDGRDILDTKNMHLDGDVLYQCLEQQSLEALIGYGAHLNVFFEHLDALEGGVHTRDLGSAGLSKMECRVKYFELAYEVLAYLFAPAI